MSTKLMCDDDLNTPAVYLYTWEWGEKGACSERGRAMREQLAHNLNRSCRFDAIPDDEPKPMLRDERSSLAGQIYALTAENQELRDRGAAMYLELDRLRSDNRLLLLQNREGQALQAEMKLAVDRAAENLEKAVRKTHDLEEEVGLLRAIQPTQEDAQRLTHALQAENKALSELAEAKERIKALEARLT